MIDDSRILSRGFTHAFSLAGCLTIAIALMTGCSGKKTGPSPRVPVVVGKVTAQSEPLSLNAVGFVEPIEAVSVKAQVSGVVTRVNFTEGQDVSAGQTLFQIDPRPFQAALNAAKAQLARDSSQAANAEIQSKRYSDLAQKDYVTQEQFDAARTQAEALKSTMRADEAAVEQARLNLGYASVTAPISGRTGSLLVKKGNVARANDLPLVVINQIRPIRASFAIPENQLPQVRKYASKKTLQVLVRTSRNGGSSAVKGRLVFMDNEVDANTGTFTLKAEFPNHDSSLWPGQFVDVELILTVESNVLTVPADAVVTGQDGTFVYSIGSDNKAVKRLVKVNRTLDSVAVIDEGVKAGETVVTDGQMRLVPGAVVEIKTDAPKPGSAP
jgi:multidrug efflux system membrane fusion protein